ncbi:MAG: tripartite tricarboxylate transporter substrate binding protein [Betaproteobacteria bacterium]|nr:tripartite tricarboxylate transporter substrate binding protein [Betaproteobacteria bacterium]
MRSLSERHRSTNTTIRTEDLMNAIVRSVSAALLWSISTAILAQPAPRGIEGDYPNRPVRLIIPFTPGGSNDNVARILGARLSQLWGQQVVPDNRVGANGIIGTALAAQAPPDGHTMVIASTTFAINPTTHKLPYDSLKDFQPVALVGDGPLILCAHPAFPARTVKELISLARTKPKELQYGISGVGGVTHLAMLRLQKMTGTSMVHVAYKGSGAAVIDILSGQVPLIMSSVSPILAHLNSGKLRVLGLGGAKRSALLPNIATIAESGVAGYEASIWWGILVTRATPKFIVDKLDRDIGRSLEDRDVQERFASLGMEPRHAPSTQFAKLLASEISDFSKLIKEAGITTQ